MNINSSNSVQNIEFLRKSMKKTIRRHARASIHLKLLKNKRSPRKQNSINRSNIELIIS